METKFTIGSRPKNDGDFGNDIVIRGHLGRDAEMFFTPAGVANTKFSVAVWNGKKPALPWWVECVAWEDMAMAAAEQLIKGTLVEIKGWFSERAYKDRKYLTLNVKHIMILLKEEDVPRVVVQEIDPATIPDDEKKFFTTPF